MVHTLQEAENYCNSFITPKDEVRARTLDRMKTLMDLLGNPQKNLTVIHVGGSSGKSSTAFMTAALLEATGLNVGLHTKPHLQKITQRCCINQTPISDNKFISYINKIQPYVNNMVEKPTYFELLVAITLWYFADTCVDVAVMEVGRGGRVDATNICASKLFILTNVSLMHTDILGYTLQDIAKEKMGIVKDSHTSVITGVTQPKLQKYIQELGQQLHIPVTIIATKKQITPQQKNQELAIAAVKQFTSITDAQIYSCLSTMQIPGRMEIRVINGNTLIMDNAKTYAFIESLRQLFPNKKMHVILPAQFQKNTKSIMQRVSSFASDFIFVTFPERMPTTYDKKRLQKMNVMNIEQLKQRYMDKKTQDIFLVTGSMKLIGAIRTILKLPFALK